MLNMNDTCPLCLCNKTALWIQDKNRRYFRCQKCQLIFADKQSQLPAKQERAIYDLHENYAYDVGYRKFLSRIAAPMLLKLKKHYEQNLQGMDFGCGPQPALATMFTEAGYSMSVFDPYFAPDKTVLNRQYDFVTCTEAIEHFYQPSKEWALLVNLVREGGYLGIMTKLARDVEAFKQWHYKNDPTHVSFFSKETFLFLAERDGFEVEFIANDAILFTKLKKREYHDS